MVCGGNHRKVFVQCELPHLFFSTFLFLPSLFSLSLSLPLSLLSSLPFSFSFFLLFSLSFYLSFSHSLSSDPAIVGKAFVKQYYTQMHKDPSQMHRFYLDQSSFVHGGADMGSEEPVIGQKV